MMARMTIRECWPILLLLVFLLWSMAASILNPRPYHPPIRPKVEAGF